MGGLHRLGLISTFHLGLNSANIEKTEEALKIRLHPVGLALCEQVCAFIVKIL